ncbi:hypothetical protein EPA93_17915 [Ktedonosporobacter rubrisoli]|uniref:Aminoglycoside phosphotransferase domain-containing protein n=1 Tax=Ktedonosporobacter rubrisoli TaxID=2509675 RepID=A0A4P6JQQ9_KTERU|nr:phosphotransferase [Ktedonosporobacter rubrisoli]QBD77768.1 hypothetical protein EPA93_17915 [Ktedonosporobacter rubrisoli]
MQDLRKLECAWKLSPILETRVPDTGTIHQTLLLSTAEGSYALRAYRYGQEKLWRIEAEHRLIAHVWASGLPAIRPLPLAQGGTILASQGRYYALFPFAEGQQIARTKLSVKEMAAMGSFLGWVHRALASYAHDKVPPRPLAVDHEATMRQIDVLVELISARAGLDEVDEIALSRLEQRRRWLISAQPAQNTMAHLEQQVIHGDYQESNIFFKDGAVCAIIDWDQAYVAPRAWEIMRVFHYVGKFAPVFCRTFLQAYREAFPLALEDLDSAAEAYSWIRAHDLWLYEEFYMHHNQRVRKLFDPSSFRPLIERWAQVRGALQ